MTISDAQLYREGMTTDQIAGFRAFIAKPRTPIVHAIGLAPDHLKGARLDAFERGAMIADRWLALRNAAGRARRAVRLEERRTIGIMTTVEALTPDDENMHHLQMAIGGQAR